MIYTFHQLDNTILNNKYNKDDILRFDDAHYSILKNISLLENYENEKILFITPSFVPLITCRKKEPSFNIYYMDDFFLNKNNDQFLLISEIEELINNYNFKIGMHSYFHDITYIPKKNNYDTIRHNWHTYKIPKNKQQLFFKLYSPKSRLSTPGIKYEKNNFINFSKIKKMLTIRNLEYLK